MKKCQQLASKEGNQKVCIGETASTLCDTYVVGSAAERSESRVYGPWPFLTAKQFADSLLGMPAASGFGHTHRKLYCIAQLATKSLGNPIDITTTPLHPEFGL